MIRMLIALVLLFVICFAASWVSLQLEDLANWIDEVDEFKEKPDLDNSEYDWGHNVKGYSYEGDS